MPVRIFLQKIMIDPTFIPTEENRISKTIHQTSIEGLFYIPHKSFPDDRGFYSELSRIPEIEEITGENFVVKQINQSRSNQNIARGIHAEDWNKLVTVTSGLCYCVLVDLRPSSLTFAKYESFYLGTDSKALNGSIFISRGLGNSLFSVKGPVDYIYAVDAVWSERDTSGDKAIALFDKDINIKWPVEKKDMIVSKRDLEASTLRQMFPDNFNL